MTLSFQNGWKTQFQLLGRVWICALALRDIDAKERTIFSNGKRYGQFLSFHNKEIYADVPKIPGTKRIDHNRAVKMYERAAGDKTLPSDLRPPRVLKASV